jgi:hypothetical protein
MLWFKKKEKISSFEYDLLQKLKDRLTKIVDIHQKRIELLENSLHVKE